MLIAPAAHALDPQKRITQYLHTSWRIQDGSVPAGMQAVSQSPDGFLWFTSTNEAYRFDGVRFVPWLPTAGAGAVEGILAVLGDHTGGLWALGTHEITHVKAGIVLSHFKVQGRLYAGGAVVSDDPGSSLWIVQSGLGDVPALCHVNDHDMQCFGKADGIPIPGAFSLLADGKGGFWLGGLGSIVHWSAGVSQVYPVTVRSELGARVLSMAQGPDGSLWAGSLAKGIGLGRLINGVFSPFVTPGFDGRKLAVTGMTFDRDGNLWVATATQGLFRIHGFAVDHYGRMEGLSGDNVQALFADREGLLWVATTNGIDSFRDPIITSFSATEGLASDLAQGVLASKDGSVWVADGESLDHLEHGKITSIRYGSGLPGDQVSAMLEDRAGNLWVGVFNGLYLVKNGKFRRIPEPDRQPCGLVYSITEDTEGNIWAVCVGPPWKLARIRDFQIREELTEAQIPRGNHLAADPRDGIWLGTTRGELVRFHHGTVEKFSLNEKSNSGSPRIVAAEGGLVLAGFNDGLVGWRDSKVQRMSTRNGLPCDQIFSFLEDREQRWWLYTDCGVVELPDSELQRWWANPETVVHTRLYDVLDGARPGGYAFFNAGAYSPDGRVWFANGSAVQMLDPSQLSQRALPAMTYIESVSVDRKELAGTANLRLAPHPRDLQIDYTSPSFLTPQRIKFRYRLDGYDQDWHDVGTRRQAFYTDLPPGSFSFRVIACNSDGVWNDSGAKLDFSIAPAYYQTNWFRAFCVASFLALLWVLYRLRLRQLEEQEKKFREAVESMPALALVARADGYCTFVNLGWMEYTGMTLEQTSGLGWQAAIHPDDRKRVLARWETALTAGEHFEYESRLRRGGDGQYRWFMVRVVPVRDKRGTVVKWCGVAADIQDRKNAEKLQADLAHVNRVSILGELAASIAHEINQPLSGVVSNGEACLLWLAADAPNVEEVREAAARIVRDGTRAGEIIQRLRSLYKKALPRRELVDLNEIAREMVVLLRGEANRFAVSIRTDLAADVPKITADRVQMQQVLMNLMLNAIEAMKETGGVLTINSQPEDGHVLISVSDTGVGLPTENTDRIFEAFFTTRPQGSGMGLAISRSIVESHGGRLWATPNSGRGASFHFSLPTATEVPKSPSAS